MRRVLRDLKLLIDAKGSLRGAAKHLRISPAYLSDIMRGNRAVSELIAKKLGYQRIVKTTITFVKGHTP